MNISTEKLKLCIKLLAETKRKAIGTSPKKNYETGYSLGFVDGLEYVREYIVLALETIEENEYAIQLAEMHSELAELKEIVEEIIKENEKEGEGEENGI